MTNKGRIKKVAVANSGKDNPRRTMIASTSKKITKTEKPKETWICPICAEAKPKADVFDAPCNTSHPFCNLCISKYISAKLEGKNLPINCPDSKCKRVLDPEMCRSIVSKKVCDKWEDALCESLFDGIVKYYCPFRGCSAMLIDDVVGGVGITSVECPMCHRLFCASCNVPWHAGMGCNEFSTSKKMDEIQSQERMTLDLAKSMKWRRCPNCNFYVEKSSGCLHIKCRCGYEFCYTCGSKWALIHPCSPT